MTKRATIYRPTRTMSDEKRDELLEKLTKIQDDAYQGNIMHSAIAAAHEEVHDRLSEVRNGEMGVMEAAGWLVGAADVMEDTFCLPLPALNEASEIYRTAAKKLINLSRQYHLVE